MDDYLEILTDEEEKDFVVINFSESLREEQNLRKIAKSFYFVLTTPDEVQSSSSDNCTHHIVHIDEACKSMHQRL